MFEQERTQMVELQLEGRAISNREVLQAMEKVPRHLFVDKKLKDQAYEDHPLPIGFGQTISQPYIVAYMLELSVPSPSKRLLEIGSGCGYLVAVASHLFKEVVGIERIEGLVQKSRQYLEKLHVNNTRLLCADGALGDLDEELFDAIIISCAVSDIPQSLLNQLAPNGLLIAPVGQEFFQELVIVEKLDDGSFERSYRGGVRFVPLLPGTEKA